MPLLTTIEIEEGILLLTITRPERRNALSSNTLAALHREVDRIAGDPTVRVVVLTGEGIGFCSGADLKSGPEDSDDLVGVPSGELLSRVDQPDRGHLCGPGADGEPVREDPPPPASP